MDWDEIFEGGHGEWIAGASNVSLAGLEKELHRPVSKKEAAAVTKQRKLARIDAEIDATQWPIPEFPLPASYLSFLSWSNGGSFQREARAFNPFFSSGELRDYLLAYEVPLYMPGALPIAFDGGGGFYMFDMRVFRADGDYPVLFSHSGSLSYRGARAVASSFLDLCRGSSDPHDS